MRWLIAMGVLFSPMASIADELPDGIKLGVTSDSHELTASQGGVTVKLPRDREEGVATSVSKVTVANGQVTISYAGCHEAGEDQDATFALAEIQARLENGKAYALFAKKQYAAAAAGFAKAVALWPALDLAYDNLASALVRQGKPKDAALALVPYAKMNPAWVEWRLLTDDDLGPIKDSPVLTAVLHAPHPGNATVKDLNSVAAWSQMHALVASVTTWGQENPAPVGTELRIVEVPSGKVVAFLTLVEQSDLDADQCEANNFDDCKVKKSSVAAVKRRDAVANQLLRDLGFVLDRAWIGHRESAYPLKISWTTPALRFDDDGLKTAAGKVVISGARSHLSWVSLIPGYLVSGWINQSAQSCIHMQPMEIDLDKISETHE